MTRLGLRTWCATLMKILWSVYVLLTSFYCLLAYLPYTYVALIKAPPYAWMPWFANHQAILYWAFWFMLTIALFLSDGVRRHLTLLIGFAVVGLYVSVRPFLPGLENDVNAFWWSLGSLFPLTVLGLAEVGSGWRRIQKEGSGQPLLGYFNAVAVGAYIALLYSGAAEYRKFAGMEGMLFRPRYEAALIFWSLASHMMIAVLIVSVVNLTWFVARRTSQPHRVRVMLLVLLIIAGLWTALGHFFANTFSFEGWLAQMYAGLLATSATLFSWALLSSSSEPAQAAAETAKPGAKAIWIGLCAAMSILALTLPAIIRGGDWNGILQHTFTLGLWAVLGVCAYRLMPRRSAYSIAAVLAILVFSLASYKSMQASEIFWAKALGHTDDDIARTMEGYSNADASFQLAYHLLGNSAAPPCGDLCRIMRQYTNIRNAQAKVDVNLVDDLEPATGPRPNIFIFVIDSMRPDYLGAYNPKVDFTPNLDRFARESIAVKNAYTQYAGTTLSEPAIWSGALLLHSHFLQPFEKVNSLERLAHADRYQVVLSYDTVLAQLFPASADIVKLDTDKTMWNGFEACSTVEQTENFLDRRQDKDRPVLFYAQPMNVHQFAKNQNTFPDAEHWRPRPGFNNRVAREVSQVDQCLGGFIDFLKARKLYENSVVILTSDHGDATGELGRSSHSIYIYPEIMHVPLIVHLPASLRRTMIYDDSRISTLTDITPSLYYLLGHRPIVHNLLFGRPLFVQTREELESYQRTDLLLASDVRADYGILGGNGRWLYVTYDSPPQSMLFDLANDPGAQHNVLTPATKKMYDKQIIEGLQAIANYYEYKPQVGSWLSAAK